MADLNEQVARLDAAQVDAAKAKSKLEARIAELEKALETASKASGHLKQLEAALAEKMKGGEQMAARASELERALAEANKAARRAEEAENARAGTEKANRLLSGRVADLEKSLAEAKSAVDAESERLNRLREEKKSLVEQNVRVVESAQGEIKLLREKIEKAVREAGSGAAEKESRIAALDTRVRELEKSAGSAVAASEELAARLRTAQAEGQIAAIREKQSRNFFKGMIRELQNALSRMEEELLRERDLRMGDMRRAVRLEQELAEVKSGGRRPMEYEDVGQSGAGSLVSLEMQAERELKVWHQARKDSGASLRR
jgi:chromosome segregation ATPase